MSKQANKTYFITAIDTEVGKTIATGRLAKKILQQRNSVITMKVAQTGCEQYAEDIQTHRQLMGIDWQPVDTAGLTCPYVFSFPASPHLSAELDGERIELAAIKQSLAQLQQQYETVLLEGVGGLMVPLNPQQLLVDLVEELALPTILVTSGRLGSINHTLLSLSLLKSRNIPLHGIIFNHYPHSDPTITQSTQDYLKNYLAIHEPTAVWGEMSAEYTDKLVYDI